MVKNIMAVFVLGLVALFFSGCVGMLPEKSWTEYRAEQKKIDSPNSGVQVKKTHIPGDGVKGSVSYNGKGAGIEVHDESNHSEDKTVIKLFGGTEGPDYDEARRDEKESARRLKEQKLRQLAIDLAEQHAAKGRMSYEGVPGQYYPEYKRAYESFANRSNQQDFNKYRNREYDRGVEDYRAKNPEYAKTAQIVDQIREQARQDAREDVFYPPDDKRFIKDYKDAHREEVRRLEKEYRRQHDRRQ